VLVSLCTLQHKKSQFISESVCQLTPGTGHSCLSSWRLQCFSSRFPSTHSESPTDGPEHGGGSGVWSTKKDTCHSTTHWPLLATHGCLNQIQLTNAAYGVTSGSAASYLQSTLSYRLMLLLDHCVPLRKVAWYFHPHTQGTLSLSCSRLWFHDGGTTYQMLSGAGASLFTLKNILIWDKGDVSKWISHLIRHFTKRKQKTHTKEKETLNGTNKNKDE